MPEGINLGPQRKNGGRDLDSFRSGDYSRATLLDAGKKIMLVQQLRAGLSLSRKRERRGNIGTPPTATASEIEIKFLMEAGRIGVLVSFFFLFS